MVVNITTPFLAPIMLAEWYVELSHVPSNHISEWSNFMFHWVLLWIMGFSCFRVNTLSTTRFGPRLSSFTLSIISLYWWGSSAFANIILQRRSFIGFKLHRVYFPTSTLGPKEHLQTSVTSFALDRWENVSEATGLCWRFNLKPGTLDLMCRLGSILSLLSTER